ncbi:hypothetical protein B296_00014195 [Ensete ventricosum]|uniref:Uncharacterized protein n=1 Tax=Ensete ventricosum TaxID=4639 RepID=A0A426Y383_ENSVE|nr:hypothetical protein B296_00014195 [Ensete ventricosum]
MSPGDMKAFRALEIIRSCHSSDLVMIEELLRLVRWRYSIPSDYELHILQPGQCPFDPFLNGFGLSIDVLKRGELQQEVDELHFHLGVSQCQLKEIQGKVRIMEDDMLKISQDLEMAQAKVRETEEALHIGL